ncbi:MAG: DUF554 domain-containing protein [Desulfovibrionaceae bacterium]
MLLPLGPLVNALAIFSGACIGMLLGARMPERVRQIVFQGIGLCVLIIGVQNALKTAYPLIMIFSIVLGSVIGEMLNLEDRLSHVGDTLKQHISSANPRFTEGFLGASVIFCVGAMAILGSFEEGLGHGRNIVYTKSILDGFTAMAMASALGLGVLFSGFSVLIYQGLLVLFASLLIPWLSPPVMTELTATGGIIILGIGINMLELLRIRLANMIPALLVVVILSYVGI